MLFRCWFWSNFTWIQSMKRFWRRFATVQRKRTSNGTSRCIHICVITNNLKFESYSWIKDSKNIWLMLLSETQSKDIFTFDMIFTKRFSVFSVLFSPWLNEEDEKQLLLISFVTAWEREVVLWREHFVGNLATITRFI